MTEPTRPVMRYFGGKWVLAPWIISQFPSHRTYVEPFGGGGSVLMRKPRSYAEVYNDLNSEVVNVFSVLRNPVLSRELERALALTPFARAEFDQSYEDTADPVEGARRTIVRSFMGFGSNSVNRGAKTGFRANSNRSNTTPAHDWANYAECISVFHERLRGVVIENRQAMEVMDQQDGKDTLHFVDPPYVHETRKEKNGYAFEMGNDDHVALLVGLQRLEGMVVLCGYEHPLYDSLCWHSLKREALADGARERTEVLWFNDAAWNAKPQAEMFGGIA